jgi:hypothetical protein
LTSADRLALIYEQLVGAGLRVVVLGGHAVRYYGVDRNTVDYDFHVALSAEEWRQLPDRLAPLFVDLREGPSWRPDDFRRFVVGRLADGRDELVECWRRNHLLAPFPELWARREEGAYGGRSVAFLGLRDLIRSKETERESDWQDVAVLEEIADLRSTAAAKTVAETCETLAALRSRRGYEEVARRGWLVDGTLVAGALDRARHPLALAFLLPSSPRHPIRPEPEPPAAIAELLGGVVRDVPPGTARHLALVEAVRRLWKRAAMESDRADKEEASRS